MKNPETHTNKLASAVLNLVQPLSGERNLKQSPSIQNEAAMQSKPKSQVTTNKITPKDTNTEQQRRDQFLKSLSSEQQVDVLLWAEKHNIKPSDPTWLLVDMLGYTQHYSETLPNQIKAACQQSVDAISSQRKAEGEAFAYNAARITENMLQNAIHKMLQESSTITTHKLRDQLRINSLFILAGMLIFSAVSFFTGFLVGLGDIHWLTNPADNIIIRGLQVILMIPVGYVAISTIVAATFFTIWQYIKTMKLLH